MSDHIIAEHHTSEREIFRTLVKAHGGMCPECGKDFMKKYGLRGDFEDLEGFVQENLKQAIEQHNYRKHMSPEEQLQYDVSKGSIE